MCCQTGDTIDYLPHMLRGLRFCVCPELDTDGKTLKGVDCSVLHSLVRVLFVTVGMASKHVCGDRVTASI